MIFTDELEYNRIYKKGLYLPITDDDKLKGSVVFLLSSSHQLSLSLLNNPLLLTRYYRSYYIEKNVVYYINQEGYIDRGLKPEVITESSLSNEERKKLKDSDFGIPEERKYPLIDKYHVLQAIKYFNKANPKYEAELAKNINKQIKKFELKVNVGNNNRFKNYFVDSYKEAFYIGGLYDDIVSNDDFIRVKTETNNIAFGFNSNVNPINENKIYNNKLKKLLYKERFKTPKEVLNIYDTMRKTYPFIKKTFLNYEKYKSENLIVDLGYYCESFFKERLMSDINKQSLLFDDFLNRLINDNRLNNLYSKKTVLIPLQGWEDEDNNPISLFIRMAKNIKNKELLRKWKKVDFIIFDDYGYFKVNIGDLQMNNIYKVIELKKKLADHEVIQSDNTESKKSIVSSITKKLEKNKNIKIHSLVGDNKNSEKDSLIKEINKAAENSDSESQAIDKLDNSDSREDIKQIIAKLSIDDDDVKISAARVNRINTNRNNLFKKKIDNVTIKELINESKVNKPLPSTKLELDTINDEWENMKFININDTDVYNPNSDIMRILDSFSQKSNPISCLDVQIENTSTSEDYIETVVAKMEDAQGQRFKLTFDVPLTKDGKFMFLRGNEKTINNQLMLIPISKTDNDTVQLVSNYNKIFIRRFGTTPGKSFETVNRMMKVFNKLESKNFKIKYGDNSRICSKYELPIDFIDLASTYDTIESSTVIIYFNLDTLYKKYGNKIDKNNGKLPIGIFKNSNKILYYDYIIGQTYSNYINSYFVIDKEYDEEYKRTKALSKYTYSKASILNNTIPLIVILGYTEKLTNVLERANINYYLSEKKKTDTTGYSSIKFLDGYLYYYNDYNSSLLMNGLKECNTEDYLLENLNDKSMFLNFLDLFGGRILADGLDNFADLLIDPITYNVLLRYDLPTDYVGLLLEANKILSDNKYIKHINLASNRFRSNELIAAYVYDCLASSYGTYSSCIKKGRKVPMTIKKSAVIDAILLDPTSSDTSNINELQIAESLNTVSFKGKSGMNSDRSYSLDKRTFDKSMINILGMSTGFAGNVGVNRQATIDANIDGSRGYLKMLNDPKDMSITKTFTITEANTPFGTTRDDPFRTAMTFIQTSKHGMRIKHGMPSLISNGADQALPYITSNTFSFVSKDNGKVVEKNDDYMIVHYKNGKYDFVDLHNKIEKNSNGGFFISVKLDTDLKVGDTVKKNQVLAYDKLSYSDIIGNTKNIAYNIGILVKLAIMNTDEGYEDSTIISERLCDAMESDIVIEKSVSLKKDSNVYSMVKKGDNIKEGDPLMVFQNAFEDNDVNLLLKNLSADQSEISDLGRKVAKSSVEGTIEDIKIYRTVEKEELSDSLKKIVNKYESGIHSIKKDMKKYNIQYNTEIPADYKLEPTGKLKNVDEGVLICFYLKYEDMMSIGDKLVYYSALKGVVKDIFPKGKEPYSEYRKDEKMDSLLSIGSINARMVTSVLILGIINKGLIELDRHVKDICGVKWKYLNELKY